MIFWGDQYLLSLQFYTALCFLGCTLMEHKIGFWRAKCKYVPNHNPTVKEAFRYLNVMTCTCNPLHVTKIKASLLLTNGGVLYDRGKKRVINKKLIKKTVFKKSLRFHACGIVCAFTMIFKGHIIERGYSLRWHKQKQKVRLRQATDHKKSLET